MNKNQVRTSRFLSLILRHKPEEAGLTLDDSGWCSVDDLLRGCAANGYGISREELDAVVAENDKKRFQFSGDGKRIRASQGHSIEVDLQYAPKQPPETLYHGTATRFIDSIKKLGLIKGSRQQVHLSADLDTAFKVGERHGKPAVIPVDAKEMYASGIPFYLTPNGVWLVDAVPPRYLHFDDFHLSRDASQQKQK
jgi:putative RNA 2'-phosphotransferase